MNKENFTRLNSLNEWSNQFGEECEKDLRESRRREAEKRDVKRGLVPTPWYDTEDLGRNCALLGGFTVINGRKVFHLLSMISPLRETEKKLYKTRIANAVIFHAKHYVIERDK